MAETKINFSDYPASGVYFYEIDNSVITSTSVLSALRLAVGFNMTGPFNRPIYVDSTKTLNALMGGIDRKLERKGCFTNRNIRTMVGKSPVFALNLMPINTKTVSGPDSFSTNPDLVGTALMSLDASKSYGAVEGSYPYAYLYDRSKFWVADDDQFVRNVFQNLTTTKDSSVLSLEESGLFGVANCGTKDISIIVRKAEDVTGYNVTFLDYYGNQESIPYKWINPNDFVSDYFIQVIAIKGNWGSDKYDSLVNDAFWGSYFTKDGLKKELINKFLRLDQVTILGNWTGCIIPQFYDKQGANKSIDSIINQSCNETGVMFGINDAALEYIAVDGSTYFYDTDGTGKRNDDDNSPKPIAKSAPDFVGNLIDCSTNAFGFMSCNMDPSKGVKEYVCANAPLDSSSMFAVLDASSGNDINIGDYVRSATGAMTRIIKKRGVADTTIGTYYRFTTYDIVNGSAGSKIEVHKSHSTMYETLKFFALKGLKITNRHMPGFDASGNTNNEAGVEKIYKMLTDDGIRTGLLNNDMIDFRYIVDTMAFGLKENCGAKKYLSDIASSKKHCLALINAPSMSQFAESDEPFFGDDYNKTEGTRTIFKVKYIPDGGNQNLVYAADTESFTLPDLDNGSTHCAIFAPFLKYGDGAKTVLIPPAADISNTFMNKFMGGNPYCTVANLNGIITNSSMTGLEMIFSDEERGYLEKFGINPIINRSGNIMIYGDRTAYQDVDSDLNFIHVREILNTIQISCRAVLNDYVYTYNTPLNRAEIVSKINPILSAMKDSDALAKYEIECDEENNTKEVIDNKFCIVNIGVWINQNMEKIVVPITINRSTDA